MALDNLVLKKITNDLNEELSGAFLEKPFALAPNQFAFPYHSSKDKENKGRGTFIISLEPSNPFVSYSFLRFQKVNINTPFFNSLKHLEGNRIKSVFKREGERIIVLETEVVSLGLDSLSNGYELVIELFPQTPNVYLIPEPHDHIESIYRETNDVFKERYMARGFTYIPPQPRKEISLDCKDEEEASSYLSFSTRRHFQQYVQKVGFSKALEDMLSSPNNYLIGKNLEPCSFGEDNAKPVLTKDIYSLFVDNQRELAHNLAEADLIKSIEKAQTVAERKKKHLVEDLASAKKKLVYMEYGQLLYANSALYHPKDKQMVIDNVTIPLKPEWDLSRNAQDYFRRYKKAKTASEILGPMIEKTEDEISYLKMKKNEALKGRGEDILELKEELVKEGYLKGKNAMRLGKKHIEKAQPHYLTSPDYKIGFGLNAYQNEHLTFEIAKKDNTFVHVKDYPGSHVVILEGYNEDTLLLAGELALYLSELSSGDVIYTAVKNVRKNKNKKGLVTFHTYNSFHIREIRESSLSLFKKALKLN